MKIKNYEPFKKYTEFHKNLMKIIYEKLINLKKSLV